MNLKQIDLLERSSLVNIAVKLKIKGHSNMYNKPYIKKELLKKIILDEIKSIKKRRRAHSVSDMNHKSVKSTNNDSAFNSDTTETNKIRRSKSFSSFRKKSLKKNSSSMNDIFQNYDIERCMFPKVSKLVAIGDIHGDLSVAIKALKLGGVIDNSIPDDTRDINNIHWTGGDTYVVQLGDQIDRVRPTKLFNNLCSEEDSDLVKDEGSDLKIISLFENLHREAKRAGGALFSIFGNHELMNVDGDFRYVSPREFHEFGNFFNGKYEQNSQYPFGYKERLEVFKPGGLLSCRLALTRYSVLQIGSWLFVHGSISPRCASQYSLNDINSSIKNWLLGKGTENIGELYHTEQDDDSPFWSRIYSDMDEWDEQRGVNSFKQTINNLNIKNLRNSNNIIKGMVMGHSPQFMYNRGINSSYDNRIWRVDIGASKAFGEVGSTPECMHRRVHVLIIEDNEKFHIVKEKC